MSHVTEIPFWVVASIGKRVALVVEFVRPCETYSPGSEGTLVAIQWCAENGIYAIVALDPEDDSYWENFAFSDIRPVANLSYSLEVTDSSSGFSVPLRGADTGSIVF